MGKTSQNPALTDLDMVLIESVVKSIILSEVGRSLNPSLPDVSLDELELIIIKRCESELFIYFPYEISERHIEHATKVVMDVMETFKKSITTNYSGK